METNEIRTDEVFEAVIDGTESVIDAAAEGAKDTAKVYIGAAALAAVAITIGVQSAWKYAVKPGIKKLKELKKKHDEKNLEIYIDTDEADDLSKNKNEG